MRAEKRHTSKRGRAFAYKERIEPMRQKLETLKDVTIDLLEALDRPTDGTNKEKVAARREACAAIFLDTISKITAELTGVLQEITGSLERIRAKV